MRTFCLLILSFFFLIPVALFPQRHSFQPKITKKGAGKVIPWVDNTGYWKKMTRLGFVEPEPVYPIKPAVINSSKVFVNGRFLADSPDIPVTEEMETTQSENSVFIDPGNEEWLMNSNNSADTNWSTGVTFLGTDFFHSEDAAMTWGGLTQGAGGSNNGDPATVVGLNGWWYIGMISNGFGQSVACSKDQGTTWTTVQVAPTSGNNYVLDKNHLMIDNFPTSPYQGYLYDAWTVAVTGSPDEADVVLSRSTDQGLNWQSPVNISDAVNAGYINHGVNIQTGPNGEVYTTWVIYDSYPANETAIGFTKSINGGAVFEPARRILGNIRGIRYDGTNKLMRVNSFPSMAVDVSGGLYNGNIYIVWANRGYPGINLYDDIDIYLIRSADMGETWSDPIRVNQDYPGIGKEHFFPWITCDPDNGNLCVIYYDDRNVAPENCQTYISYSYDGGNTWTDMKVSDVTFTPSPIPGLAAGYFGDYIGISSKGRKVYPVWTDNRSGQAMTYVSPIDLGPAPGQPYLVYQSYDLISMSGQAGQTMNFGDSLHLSMGLKNIGDREVSNVTAILSSPSPWVLITDSVCHYDHFNPGEIRVADTGYSFRVSDSIPDGMRIRFDIRATDGDSSWYSHFGIESHAPAPAILGYAILDSVNGNNNHRLDPGEIATVRLSVKNKGDFPCVHAEASMNTSYQFIDILTNNMAIDTMEAGDTVYYDFQVHVDEESTTGIPFQVSFLVKSGFYGTSGVYDEMIGIVSEDWESHSFTKFPWYFSGDKPWILSTDNPYEGSYCAKSGFIHDLESSEMNVVYQSSVDDSISFYRKVSCEETWDHLVFYIDSVYIDYWSGEAPWGRVAFPVKAGKHTFRWVYEKDIDVTTGQDRAWVDLIEFPPPLLPVVNAGPYDTICAGQNYLLQGTASVYDSVIWFSSGDGIFSDPKILTPEYIPGSGDLQAGLVKLTLKAFDTLGNVSAFMKLTMNIIPDIHITAEPNDTICSWQTVYLHSNATGADSIHWTPGDFTTEDISVSLAAVGEPGSYWFGAWAGTVENCTARDSILIHFKDCVGIDDPEKRFTVEVYPNPNQGSFVLKIVTNKRQPVDLRLFSSLNINIFEEKNWLVDEVTVRQFDFSTLSPGAYFLKMNWKEGEKIFKIFIR